MTNDLGRPPDGSGSRPTDEAASCTASSPEASIPNAADGQPMPSGEPIYVAVVLAKKWIDQNELETKWTLGWSTHRESALGGAVDACRLKNPGFDISTTDIIKISRERISKSSSFWAGFFAAFFVVAFAVIAASAMSAGTAETQSGSGLQPASAVPKADAPTHVAKGVRP